MTSQASRHPAPITDETFRAAVRAVAAERPDFVYEAPHGPSSPCRYEHNGAPHCLIGQALYRLGVTIEELRTADSGEHGGTGATTVLPVLAPLVGSETREWAHVAQTWQDLGYAWGYAVTRAEEEGE